MTDDKRKTGAAEVGWAFPISTTGTAERGSIIDGQQTYDRGHHEERAEQH